MLLYLLIDISVVLVFRSWSSLRPLSCNDNPVKTFNDVTGQVYHLHDLLELFLRILKAFFFGISVSFQKCSLQLYCVFQV